MKKVIALLTLLASVHAYSQGTVAFQNRNTSVVPNINAPISYDGTGPVPAQRVNGTVSVISGGFAYGGVHAMAGLYGGAAGTPEEHLVLLFPAVGFRTTAATAGYINVGSDTTRTVQGVQPGQPAVFQIRAWDAGVAGVASYEAAVALASDHFVYFGKSPLLNVAALGGGGTPPGPAADLIGLEGFSLSSVPEPSIIGLGILGAIAGLMVFRRRS